MPYQEPTAPITAIEEIRLSKDSDCGNRYQSPPGKQPHANPSIRTLLFAGLLASQSAFAGIGLVSRANCNVSPFPGIQGINFNESVSYNQFDGNNYRFQTASVHNLGGYAAQDGSNWNGMHYDSKTWEQTWRQWTGDLAHSWPLPRWHVHGVHYWVHPSSGLTYLTYTFATACNITQW